MKEIKFRPLRLCKKTNKIIVASYMSWRKVKSADHYCTFNLVVNNDYKNMNPEDYVYNHKGEQLYFYAYNPADIPIYNYSFLLDIEEIHSTTGLRAINWGDSTTYSGKGIDCDGVPTISFFTSEYIGTHCNDVNSFEPLTVKMVVYWCWWFIYNLNNVNLKIGVK